MSHRVRFSLRQLQYFVAIADAGTLTGAAQRCLVSQAGIATALDDLEKALGVQLVVRRKAKGVVLTPAGGQVLADARTLLSCSETLQSTAREAASGLSGRLTVGCYRPIAPFLLPPLLEHFDERHPGVELEVVEASQPELRALLLSGAVEAVLTYDRALDESLDRVLVATMRPYVLLPEAHPLTSRGEVSLHDLVTEPMIMLDLPPSGHDFARIFSSIGVEPWIRHRTAGFETVRSLVGRGLGYSLLVQRPRSDLTYDGRELVVRPIVEAVDGTSVVLARVAGVRSTNRLEALADYCATTLGPDICAD